MTMCYEGRYGSEKKRICNAGAAARHVVGWAWEKVARAMTRFFFGTNYHNVFANLIPKNDIKFYFKPVVC